MQLLYYLFVLLLLFWKQVLCSPLLSSITIIPEKLKEIDNIIHQLLALFPEEKSNYTVHRPIDCTDIKEIGVNQSGIYKVWPMDRNDPSSFYVYCDMETDGGGWTVFHRRGNFENLKDYFYRNWSNYSDGFGELNENFWLGNKKLHSFTNQNEYSFRYDMKDKSGKRHYAQYKVFRVGSEKESFQLHVSGYSGNAGDSFTHFHNRMKFSTFDRDNDLIKPNCADIYKVGWWFGACLYSNASGVYKSENLTVGTYGIAWFHWDGSYYSLPEVELKIRRIRR